MKEYTIQIVTGFSFDIAKRVLSIKALSRQCQARSGMAVLRHSLLGTHRRQKEV